MKINKWLKALLAVPALLLLCNSCVRQKREDELPVTIPFDPGGVGKSYTMNVKIEHENLYGVKIKYYLKLPNEYSHFLDKRNKEDGTRLSSLLGASVNNQGVWDDHGVPALFRVVITNNDTKEEVVRTEVKNVETGYTYMGRYAVLYQQFFPPGNYSIRVDYLEGSPALAGLYGRLMFAGMFSGK